MKWGRFSAGSLSQSSTWFTRFSSERLPSNFRQYVGLMPWISPSQVGQNMQPVTICCCSARTHRGVPFSYQDPSVLVVFMLYSAPREGSKNEFPTKP